MRRVIGLDIGTETVRGVELSGLNKPEPCIERFGEVRLPEGAVVGGEVAEPNTVADALQRLWKQAKFTTKDVAVGINSGRIVSRPITIDDGQPAQIKRALPLLVEDLLPFPAADALIDFYPIEHPENEPRKVRGLLIAAAKGSTDDHVRAIRRAGLNIESVDVAPFALARVHLKGYYASGEAAQIAIGRGTTSVMIARDGVPDFLRFIPSGTDEVLRQVGLQLDLDEKALSQVVRLTETDDPALKEAFESAITPLVTAINNTLHYYSSTSPNHDLSRVYLTGGGSKLIGLREQLAIKSSTWVSYADPLFGLRVHPRVDRDSLEQASVATAIGLAMNS